MSPIGPMSLMSPIGLMSQLTGQTVDSSFFYVKIWRNHHFFVILQNEKAIFV